MKYNVFLTFFVEVSSKNLVNRIKRYKFDRVSIQSIFTFFMKKGIKSDQLPTLKASIKKPNCIPILKTLRVFQIF